MSEPRLRIVDRVGNRQPLLSALRDDDVQVTMACILVLAASLVLRNTDDGGITTPFLKNRALPSVCPSKVIFGVSCPGCGMVRSFVAMGHLRVGEAWRYNRVGPVLYLLILLQIPHRLRRIRCPGLKQPTASRLGTLAGYMVFIALIVNWFYNLTTGHVLVKGL